MPIRPNFSLGNVVDPTKGAQAALSNVGTIMQQRQDAENTRIEQAQDAARLAMEKQSMSNTANYRLQQQANDIQKAKMLKKYQDRVAEGIEGERKYNRDIQTGLDYGNMMNLEDTTSTRIDKYIPNREGAEAEFLLRSKRLKPVPTDKDNRAAYHEYRLESDPSYVKGSPEKVVDTAIKSSTLGPAATIYGIKSLYDFFKKDSSEAGVYKESIKPKPTSKNEVKSYEQFLSGRYGQKEYDKAKNAIKTAILTDKSGKAFTKTQVEKLKRIPEADLLKTAGLQIEAYAKKHPKTSKATIQGMYRAMNQKIAKIHDTRATIDTQAIARFNDQADAATQAAYKEQLATLKDKLDRKPTKSELSQLKSEALDRQIKIKTFNSDVAGWFGPSEMK
jgi:hypothetical protein